MGAGIPGRRSYAGPSVAGRRSS